MNLGNPGGVLTFFICAPWSSIRTAPSNGSEDWLWVTGTKSSGINASSDISTVVDNGTTYTVWTTDTLDTIGIGFILRWRPHASGSGVGEGAWRSPGSNWTVDTPPSSAGFPFWQASYIENRQGCTDHFDAPNYSSLDTFRAAITCTVGIALVSYSAQVEVRYVVTRPASPLFSVLDDNSKTITTNLVILKGRQASHSFTGQVTVKNTVTFKIPPTGTCTTPTVAEATVNFGGIFADVIPAQGNATTAWRNFNFILRKCPRTNISYYVHANGKWANPSQGIVGLSDSTQADNPRGFGIQLWHNGDQGGTGNVYIHPNETNPPVQLYTRNWQGTGTQNITSGPEAGVRHTIPLRARVYRTSPTGTPITPGPFNASVVVVIRYP